MSEYRFTYDDWLNDRIQHPYGNDKSIYFLYKFCKLFTPADYQAIRKAQNECHEMACEALFFMWCDLFKLDEIGRSNDDIRELLDVEIKVCEKQLNKKPELFLRIKKGRKADTMHVKGSTYLTMQELLEAAKNETIATRYKINENNLYSFGFNDTMILNAKYRYLEWLRAERKKLTISDEMNKLSPPAPIDEKTKLVISRLMEYNFREFLKERNYNEQDIYFLIFDHSGKELVPFLIALLDEIKYLQYLYNEVATSWEDVFRKLAIVLDCSKRNVAGNIRVLLEKSKEDRSVFKSRDYRDKIRIYFAGKK